MSRAVCRPSAVNVAMLSRVIRVEVCPVASVDFVAYFARYPATARSETSPPPRVTGSTSTWAPQTIRHCSLVVGWVGVV